MTPSSSYLCPLILLPHFSPPPPPLFSLSCPLSLCLSVFFSLSLKVELWLDVDTTQWPRSRFDSRNLFWFCVGFTLADQSQPLLLRRPDTRLQFLGGAHQALAVDARRVRKDVMGPYPSSVASMSNHNYLYSVSLCGYPSPSLSLSLSPSLDQTLQPSKRPAIFWNVQWGTLKRLQSENSMCDNPCFKPKIYQFGFSIFQCVITLFVFFSFLFCKLGYCDFSHWWKPKTKCHPRL